MTVSRFDKNTAGLDFVVGDVHGEFSLLQAGLEKICFNHEHDRLFSVGDLVDRGAESEQVTEWLEKPWFHAVRGNHEQMAIECGIGDWLNREVYLSNGGAWFLGLPKAEQQEIAHAMNALPLAIEVGGEWGIVHAEPVGQSWQSLCMTLEHGDPLSVELLSNQIIWGRTRIKDGNPTAFPGIGKVYVGHTPVKGPIMLGNVIYIDTGAVFGGALTIVEVATDTVYRIERQAARVLH